MASGAVCGEVAFAAMVQDCLGEDGAGGVAGAEEEHVIVGGHGGQAFFSSAGWSWMELVWWRE